MSRRAFVLSFVLSSGVLSSSSASAADYSWHFGSGLFPDQVDPTMQSFGGSRDLQSDGLHVRGSGTDNLTYYEQSGANVIRPEHFVLRTRFRVVENFSELPEIRSATMFNVNLGGDVGITFGFGIDDVYYLTTDNLNRVDSARVDTDDDFHDYRLEITTSDRTFELFQDNLSILSGTTPGYGNSTASIWWGDGTIYAEGLGIWQSFEHNAAAVPEPGTMSCLALGLAAVISRSRRGRTSSMGSSMRKVSTAARPQSAHRGRAVALCILTLPGLVWAQWQVIDLHPAGRTWSGGYAMVGLQQGGSAQGHAGRWAGSSSTWVDLNPAGSFDSRCWGISNSQQVGQVNIGGVTQASLWYGTASSWVSLHPAGATLSVAFHCFGSQQVGFAAIAGVNRAGLWSGTSTSWVDVHPAGATDSRLLCTNGTVQGGYARVGGARRASIWQGSGATWADLTPTWAGEGIVYALDGATQVGTAGLRACLWNGTPASAVSLHPDGAAQSFAFASHRGIQVGGVIQIAGGPERACLWIGTKESFIDLHQYLPLSFTSSEARAVWRDAAYLYVLGYAFLPNLENHAILWKRKMPGSVAPPIR